jgi:TRAP-type C4-dicarboxylate transport system permease small subunit
VLIRRVSKFMNGAGGFLFIPVMVTGMMLEIVARYVFNSPFMWSYEFSRYMLMFVFFLGIVECTRNDEHIRMDLLFRLFPNWGRKIVSALYAVCLIGIFALVIKHAIVEIPYLLSIPVLTEYLELPVWLFHALLVVIAALMMLIGLLRIVALFADYDDESIAEKL